MNKGTIMKIGSRITIKDVAAEAGVSIATVSKYMNKLQHFSPKVEEKIRTSIIKLGYQLNPAAQSMVTGKTKMIGIAIVDIYNPYFASIIKGANRAAIASSYNLLVVDLEESTSEEMSLLKGLFPRVDGMVITARVPNLSVDFLTRLKKPFLIFGMSIYPDIPSVRADGYAGARTAGEYLYKLGKKRIAYVGYPGVSWNRYRIKGLSDALKESDAALDLFNVQTLTMAAGQGIVPQLYQTTHKPDAIIGCNDEVAIGIMRGAWDLGLRVPEDVAIMGFDNIPVSQYISPALTTIDTCAEKIGETAVSTIIKMIQEPDFNPGNILLPPNLIIRNSTEIIKQTDLRISPEV
jgi:DNA-binding LacI/PurR family transcriptional regulator